MKWHVLHTRPRHEKKVEKDLLLNGIQAYCPVKCEYKLWSDRKKKVFVPVLPSMILVRIEEKKLNDVFISRGVIGYMKWLGKKAVVRDSEIDRLKKNIEYSLGSNHKIGTKVGIRNFGNQIGIINKISKNKIWISLENLGYKLMLNKA